MSEIRISIARFWHESNSFSCSLTQITDFESYQEGTLIGPKVLANLQHRNEMAGFVEVLKGCSGIQIVPLLSAGALPSGLLAEDTVRYFEDILRGELRRAGRLDGICLALHGATSSTTVPDFDGHFLKIVRQEVGPDIPIICALDPHAIVTTQMLELCDAVFAYRTHPHVDLVETGMLAARTLMDQIRGKIKPAVSYQRIPLLFPPPDEGTHTGPMKELFDTFIESD